MTERTGTFGARDLSDTRLTRTSAGSLTGERTEQCEEEIVHDGYRNEEDPCPACGAEATWNPGKRKLVCAFCGTESAAELKTEGRIVEHDLAPLPAAEDARDHAEEERREPHLEHEREQGLRVHPDRARDLRHDQYRRPNARSIGGLPIKSEEFRRPALTRAAAASAGT